jgi:hypothetical protein
MRKLVLTLAVVALFTAPALATVTIVMECDAENDRKVWIKYESDEAERVRAFALDIQATGGNIIECNDYAVGDDNGGYGVFPGSFAAAPIQVDPQTGEVVTWEVDGYSPVAPPDDPEALGGIGTPGVTVEMGSLYDDSPPSQTEGYLCSVTCDENVTLLSVSANAIRGNVVLESAAEVQDLVMPEDLAIPCGSPPCFPSDDQDAYDFWVDQGQPDCWCYARQCYGDADGKAQGNPLFGYAYVSTDDLIILADAWQIKEPPHAEEPFLNGIADVPGGVCGDFDHMAQGNPLFGYVRVSTDDLIIMANAWQAKEPPHNDPMHAHYPNGIPGDCVPVPVEPPE